MTTDPLPPLPEDIQTLLKNAAAPQVPQMLKNEVFSRLQSSVATMPLAALSDSIHSAATTAASTATTATTHAASQVATHAITSKISATVAAVVAASLTAGTLGGVVAGRTIFAPQPKQVIVEVPKIVEVEKIVEVPVPQKVEVPRATNVPSKVEATTQKDIQLAAERSLIDRIRTALSRKDADSALLGIHEHEAKFQNGQLLEEREFLKIEALLQLGRKEDAQAVAKKFEARFPRSLLLEGVRARMGGAQ